MLRGFVCHTTFQKHHKQTLLIYASKLAAPSTNGWASKNKGGGSLSWNNLGYTGDYSLAEYYFKQTLRTIRQRSEQK